MQSLQQEESEIGLSGGNGQLLTLGIGLLATAIAATYVTKLAKVISPFSACSSSSLSKHNCC